MENIKITLQKSLISQKENKILTAKSLGLRKPGDSIVIANDATVAGKIKVLAHLIKVENV